MCSLSVLARMSEVRLELFETLSYDEEEWSRE